MESKIIFLSKIYDNIKQISVEGFSKLDTGLGLT